MINFYVTESVDETSTRQECSEGDLRLAGSETMNVGNLEVCQFGVWGSICNTEWSEANSDIACGVLGFTAGNLFPFLTIINSEN